MALTAYLAKNYLNADSSNASSDPSSSRPKKRRKKDHGKTSNPTTLTIADDDDDLGLSRSRNRGDDDAANNNGDEYNPILDSTVRSAEFRKAKKNNWKTIGAPTPKDSEQAEADRILAAAAAEGDAARAAIEAEDAPAVVDDNNNSSGMPQIRAGLQTAAETEAMVQAAAAARQKTDLKMKKSWKPPAAEEETVYRDATGRRIDVSMKRAEARALEQEKLRKEKAEREDAMGEVQRREKEQRKEDLAEAKFLGVSRYADDEAMNRELKGQVRWDDPMAGYIAQKREEEEDEDDEDEGGRKRRDKDTGGGSSSNAGRAVQQQKQKKTYTGAAPPNRYGIRPGWRWDGVDRGNGFEKEWFQARGRKARNEGLEYQWQMDE